MLIFFSSNMTMGGLKFQINSQTYLGNHFIILSWKVDSPQGIQEQKQGIVKDRELKQNHSLRELMCHGVMKMSKSLKKSFSFENLAFSESCSSFKNHKLFFFFSRTHIICQELCQVLRVKINRILFLPSMSWQFQLRSYKQMPSILNIWYPGKKSINICLLKECWLYGNYQDKKNLYSNLRTKERLSVKNENFEERKEETSRLKVPFN